MRTIPLSQGFEAIVDDEDFDFLMQWKWYASRKRNGMIYAKREKWVNNGSNKAIWMHREITSCERNKIVDHANLNTLDNRKVNLRVCSIAENTRNRRIAKHGCHSRYYGVTWDKQKSKWRADIKLNYKSHFLGYFKKEKDAAIAYDAAARNLHGDFATQNFRCLAALQAIRSSPS